MEVLIVGAGSIGRWFAEAVDAEVTFADADPDAAVEAAADLGGRAVGVDTDETFAAVVIAVPMASVVEAIHEHARRAEAAILDLGGVMAGPVAAMDEYDLQRASLHPLFAPENAPGRIALVEESGGPTLDSLLSDLAEAGNVLVETTAAEHDRAMETVQAKAHAAVLAFGLAAEAVPDGFGTPVHDGLVDLVEEVTGGTPRVYADVQDAFDGADDVAAAAERIADADREAFERLYREAASPVSAGDAPDASED